MIRILERTNERLLRFELAELKRMLSRNRDATARIIKSLRATQDNHTQLVEAIHRTEERLRPYEKEEAD